MTLVVVFALAAAFSNAVNLITQHKVSIGAPRRAKGWRLALYLPRQPLSAGLVFGAAIAVLAVLGTRGPPARRAAVFAVAAALTWALEATFLKTATGTLAASGIGGMLTDWPVYAFIAATVAGTLLQQAALHVGPLSVSQPFLVITDPFASIILSVWLFDERFTDSPAKITVAVLAFAVMAVGVTILTRTAPEDLTPS